MRSRTWIMTESPLCAGRFLAATLFSLLLTYLPVFAGSAYAQESEFPALTGRVVDLAGILDSTATTALVDALAAHENDTSNQVVVATVPSLNGYDIADYANRLGRFWQLGTAEEDNGVLVLVAPNERKVRIEVGYGLEGALPDGLASIIVQREMLPSFRSNNYTTGIQQGTAAVLAAIEGEYTAPANGKGPGKTDPFSERLGNLLPLIFIAMVAIPELLKRSGMRKAANGAFPAGFAGLFGTLASGNLIIGLAIAIGIFLLIYFTGSGGGSGRGGSGRSGYGGYIGTGGFGGGMGGGGFSGGGGSFGGGGASGSW